MWKPPLGAEFETRLLRVVDQMDLSPCNGCSQCSLRCAAGVQMTREEYDAVGRFIEESPDRDSIASITTQDKSIDLGDGLSATMCRYFDMETERCAVYPVRPLICRLLGHVEWMPCPIEKIQTVASTPDALSLLSSYCEHPRNTFDEWKFSNEQ